MNTGWIVLIEGIAIFALLIGFGVWQLRSLKKMEREDKAKAEAAGEGGESAFTRARAPKVDANAGSPAEASSAHASVADASSADASSADASSADPGHPER